MKITIRQVVIEDYDAIFALWNSTEQTRRAMNPVDDSREGIARYLKRNPDAPDRSERLARGAALPQVRGNLRVVRLRALAVVGIQARPVFLSAHRRQRDTLRQPGSWRSGPGAGEGMIYRFLSLCLFRLAYIAELNMGCIFHVSFYLL